MKKSSSHRKRHVPPGPVGIWFQSHQELNSTKQRSGDGGGNSSTLVQGGHHQKHHSTQESDSSDKETCANMSFSPVWTNVQQELRIVTPYLPTWNNDPSQRYHWLRPHLPPEYMLLYEIRRGDYDFSTSDDNRLLVLVHSIESNNLHNILTVELQDETGLTIRAWVEPRYVQEQMQQQHEMSTIRPGVIWMLSGIGMMVETNEHEEKLERILLIGGKNISKMWTPEETKKKDSRESQAEFLQWMERRKAISNCISETNEEEDDDRSDSSKENTSHANNQYSQTSKDSSEQPNTTNFDEDRQEENDWVRLLNTQRQGENCQAINNPEKNFSHTLQQKQQQQQSLSQNALDLRNLNSQGRSCNRMRSSDDDNLNNNNNSQQNKSATNSDRSSSPAHFPTNELQQNEVMSKFYNIDTTQTKRAYNHLSSEDGDHIDVEKSPNKLRKEQKTSHDQITNSRKSPEVSNQPVSRGKFGLWDVNDTSMLDLLEEDDEEEENEEEFRSEQVDNKPEASISQSSFSAATTTTTTTTSSQDKNHVSSKSTSTSQSTTRDDADDAVSTDLRPNKTPQKSMFDASNFEGVDLSAFDEDDDEEF